MIFLKTPNVLLGTVFAEADTSYYITVLQPFVNEFTSNLQNLSPAYDPQHTMIRAIDTNPLTIFYHVINYFSNESLMPNLLDHESSISI